MGIDVEVPPLTPFFDWDDDGVVGNETLQEGETISLEKKLLEVPCEGGTYTIKIDAPIDVFLESQIESGPNIDVSYGEYFELYKEYYNPNLSYTANISDNVLSIRVNPANSRSQKNAYVYLYDFLGNMLDTISIKQDGATNIEIPQLGEGGYHVVAAMFSELAGAVSHFNLVEQWYHYNELTQSADGFASSDNVNIADMWEYFYRANNRSSQIRYADRQALGVYGEVLDVFSAMIYYNMVVVWGDVPYIVDYEELNGNPYPSRTNQNAILDDLTQKLNVSIEVLEEKKNESLNLKGMDDMNKLFFVSKDVARILLADVYMYRGKYAEAKALLEDVVDAGFYSLDATNYSVPEAIEDLGFSESIDNPSAIRTSSELIFTLDASGGTRSTRATDIVIRQPLLVPMMNYTNVLLSYAECLYHTGDTGTAEKVLRQIVDAKGIEIAEGVFEGITDARQQLLLYGIGNFAFYKRNGVAVKELGIKEYQQLLPIPQREFYRNYNMTQNPGYDS